MIKKLLAAFIFVVIGMSTFKRITLVFILLFVLYYLIRFIADIFWWGKDEGKW